MEDCLSKIQVFDFFRHTQATYLLAGGEDVKTVQQRLGHQQASTTLDIYAGFIPAKDMEAASKIGVLLSRAQEEADKYGEVINL